MPTQRMTGDATSKLRATTSSWLARLALPRHKFDDISWGNDSLVSVNGHHSRKEKRLLIRRFLCFSRKRKKFQIGSSMILPSCGYKRLERGMLYTQSRLAYSEIDHADHHLCEEANGATPIDAETSGHGESLELF